MSSSQTTPRPLKRPPHRGNNLPVRLADRPAGHPPHPATLPDPQRTTAVYAIRAEVDELLGWFGSELDEWMSGEDTAIADARERLIGLTQRLDALATLGPPSREARDQLLDEMTTS